MCDKTSHSPFQGVFSHILARVSFRELSNFIICLFTPFILLCNYSIYHRLSSKTDIRCFHANHVLIGTMTCEREFCTLIFCQKTQKSTRLINFNETFDLRWPASETLKIIKLMLIRAAKYPNSQRRFNNG